MNIKKYLRSTLNLLLKRYGFEMVDSRFLYDWQKNPQTLVIHRQSPLPKGATDYLIQSNPLLQNLQARYSTFDKEVTTPFVWTNNYVNSDDILYFRGDNAYVWQRMEGNMNALSCALTTYYVKSIDKFGFLETLKEDDLFGNYGFNVDNKFVSRDLLDSIIEIYFLEKYLNVAAFKSLTVLDIGAGYGRLAHRMLNALPGIAQYFCTDAFPASTFICDYYLRFRGLEDRARVVPLDEIEHVLRSHAVDLAVNIHSFSECNISAIEWWVSRLAKYGIKNLMIVPNSSELRTNDGVEFGKIIEKHGYKMIAKDPKYGDSVVQNYAINPAYHYLFELS